MSAFLIYLTGCLSLFSFFVILWILSLWLKDSSIVDIFWGFGFVLLYLSFFTLYKADIGFNAKTLVGTLVLIWGLRLSIRIFLRNHGKQEDFRYQKWRQQSGKNWWWKSLFKVYLLQAVIACVVGLPLWAIAVKKTTLINNRLPYYIGILLWSIGFLFESVGDFQLDRFKKDPKNKGKVLKTGLWKYTRHPNYFGDSVIWWGFFFFTMTTPQFWFVWIGPFIMTFLLIRISGVKMLEDTLKKTKSEYLEYIKNTSAFFPCFPLKKGNQNK